MNDKKMRRLFDALNRSGVHEDALVLILGDLQKSEPIHWKRYVMDLMDAMECLDAGLFPDEWWDEIDPDARGPVVILGGARAEAYMNRVSQ